MFIKNKFFIFLFIFITIEYSECFVAIPFGTIYIKNNSISPDNDYPEKMHKYVVKHVFICA